MCRTSASGRARRSSTATQLDPSQRRRLGSELSPGTTIPRVPTEHDEAVMLEAADLEDMASMLFLLSVLLVLSLLNGQIVVDVLVGHEDGVG